MSNELTEEKILTYEKAQASMRRVQAYLEVDRQAGKVLPASLEALFHGLPEDASAIFDAALAEAKDNQILVLLLTEAKDNRAAAFTR